MRDIGGERHKRHRRGSHKRGDIYKRHRRGETFIRDPIGDCRESTVWVQL